MIFKAPAAVAATLVSAVALLGSTYALASEPMRLTAAQMDAVTAGGVVLQDTDAEATAVSRLRAAVTKAVTNAITERTDDRKAQASGEAAATATGDLYAGTDAGSLSLIAKDDAAYAGILVNVSGEAFGDDAFSTGRVKTNAIERGPVIIAWGWGWTYANGEAAQTIGESVPFAEGGITRTRSTTKERTTKSGGTLTITRGFAISINPEKKI